MRGKDISGIQKKWRVKDIDQNGFFFKSKNILTQAAYLEDDAFMQYFPFIKKRL